MCVIINFLSELIYDIFKLPFERTLICSRVNILEYAGDLVLVAPASQALNFLLKALTSKLHDLSLQVKVQKTYNILVRHSSKKCQQTLP